MAVTLFFPTLTCECPDGALDARTLGAPKASSECYPTRRVVSRSITQSDRGRYIRDPVVFSRPPRSDGLEVGVLRFESYIQGFF